VLIRVCARIIGPEHHGAAPRHTGISNAARCFGVGYRNLPEWGKAKPHQRLSLHNMGVGGLVDLIHAGGVFAVPAALIEYLVDMVKIAGLGQLEEDVVINGVDDILAEMLCPVPGRATEHAEMMRDREKTDQLYSFLMCWPSSSTRSHEA